MEKTDARAIQEPHWTSFELFLCGFTAIPKRVGTDTYCWCLCFGFLSFSCSGIGVCNDHSKIWKEDSTDGEQDCYPAEWHDYRKDYADYSDNHGDGVFQEPRLTLIVGGDIH